MLAGGAGTDGSPDGKWFVYITTPPGAKYKQPNVTADVTAYNFDTREHCVIFTVNEACHHVTMFDSEHFFSDHPPWHGGRCFGDLTNGTWRDLRFGDPGTRGKPCHSLPTAKGIAYEVFGAGRTVVSGLYDPFTRARFESPLPPDFGYNHTGWDPSGRLWFWETGTKN